MIFCSFSCSSYEIPCARRNHFFLIITVWMSVSSWNWSMIHLPRYSNYYILLGPCMKFVSDFYFFFLLYARFCVLPLCESSGEPSLEWLLWRLGSWLLTFGSWPLALGSRHLTLGSWPSTLGPWPSALGPRLSASALCMKVSCFGVYAKFRWPATVEPFWSLFLQLKSRALVFIVLNALNLDGNVVRYIAYLASYNRNSLNSDKSGIFHSFFLEKPI